MRNSSLVEYLRAENLPGLSITPNLRIENISVVGERSICGEVIPEGVVERIEVSMPA